MLKRSIKRGDIFIADFNEANGSVQSGLRPVVVIQKNTGNRFSSTVIVATITSKIQKKRDMPTHIVVDVDGLINESIVQLEQITTIDKKQVLDFIGTMPISVMEQIDLAIKVSLDLE